MTNIINLVMARQGNVPSSYYECTAWCLEMLGVQDALTPQDELQDEIKTKIRDAVAKSMKENFIIQDVGGITNVKPITHSKNWG